MNIIGFSSKSIERTKQCLNGVGDRVSTQALSKTKRVYFSCILLISNSMVSRAIRRKIHS